MLFIQSMSETPLLSGESATDETPAAQRRRRQYMGRAPKLNTKQRDAERLAACYSLLC